MKRKLYQSITVVTPSRIHITLIDLNGGLGRVDGGVGLSLSHPGFKITAQYADTTDIVTPIPSLRSGQALTFPHRGGRENAVPDAILQRAKEVLGLLQEKCDIGHANIRIEESIPPHAGLGSGTQLSLGIAQAVCGLYDINLSHQEMALLVGRGGTSGIGVAAFSQGGFIVDGGHKFSKGRGAPPRGKDEKASFLPSSASGGVEAPPVVARYDFPDWDILITIPNCRRISGEEEVRLFQTRCPLPLDDVQALSHIILMKLLPALVQRDLELFGEAVDQIQNIGWKKVEVEEQDPMVRRVMAFLRNNGAHGIGLSSWGPAIFCFGEDLRALEAETSAFLARTNTGGICFITRANNTGAMTRDE